MGKRRKDELIPFDRKKRVIYIERRGPKMHISAASIIFLVLGIICLLYCIGILLFVGYGTRFFLVWGVIGVCLTALGWLFAHKERMEGIPGWLKAGVAVLAGAGLLVFVLVEGLILSRFGAKPLAGADYCIILGAQMKESGPSDVLKRRLDAAVVYLNENPETKAIVSGGQGANEPVTEARGMYEYLVGQGIEPSRILLEEASGNTWGNLYYSSELLDKGEDSVVIVTNNFHVFRALGIAEKMGYEKVSGLAADSYAGMLPNNMLREFFGVIKDSLTGNL